ncbi:MAG: hypothetical protein P1U70_07005 [Saprospiraceae bacterium]|nr:hypothetical protein [Saprospiraceae bacterium]
MNKKKQKLTLIWENIHIKISYNPDYSDIHRQFCGHRLAHIEIRSEDNQRLLMTETGYRSHFTVATKIEAYGTPIDFVKAWLKEAEKSKDWKTYKKSINQNIQLSLF